MDRRWLFIALFWAFLFCNVSIIKSFDIQGAINSANPGDTINIPDGTYTESIDVPATLSGIIILGQSRDGTIVTNTSGSGFVISADNVSIKNLTVKGYTTGRGLDFLGGGTVTRGLVDNVIADGNGDGIAIDSVAASDFKIQNSQIINNNYSPSGIYISDSSNIQITNNQITGNSNGIDLVGTTSDITLSGNTFGSNSLYDIFNNTSNNQTATGNTWGTFDGSVIKGRIYDKLDDATLGLVTFDNTSPTVNAGTDKIKKSSFTQDATASDTFGISSYLWTAPVQITFSNSSVEDPDISASADGTYTITLTVTDTSGNTSSDTFQLVWDTVAPTFISKTTFGTGWYTSNQTSIFTYSDSGSASCIISTEGTAQTCSVTPNICDTAGNCNTSPVTSNTIKLDKTKPVSTATSPTYDNFGTILVSSISSDNLSGVINVKLWFRKNSGTWTGSATFDFDPSDIDATYEFYSIATDDAGNVESAPASADSTTIFDHTNPTGSWTSPVVNWTISGMETLSASTSDNLSGVSSVQFQYKQNNGVDTFHDTPAIWNTVGLPLDGYTGRIVVTDNAGNSINVDRNFYVAAVISKVSSYTIDTNKIQISWVTDRLSDSRVILDTASRLTIDQFNVSQYGYSLTSGTISTYTFNHVIEVTGLSDNTIYYWRVVSGGTPIVVSSEYSNKTMSTTGVTNIQSSNQSTPTQTQTTIPAIISPVVLVNFDEKVLGTNVELLPSPSPTPVVLPGSPVSNIPPTHKFNWLLVLIPSGILVLFLGLKFWRK